MTDVTHSAIRARTELTNGGRAWPNDTMWCQETAIGGDVYQNSEMVQLLMVAFLTPIMAINVRVIDIPGKRWFVAAYLVLAAGYLFTVLEGFFWFDAFNTLEHACHAGSGVLYAIAVTRLARATRTGGTRG